MISPVEGSVMVSSPVPGAVEVGLLKNSKQVFLCCAVSDAGSQFPHLSVCV